MVRGGAERKRWAVGRQTGRTLSVSLQPTLSPCLVILVFLSLPSSFPRAQLQRCCLQHSAGRQVGELRGPPGPTSFVLEAKIRVVVAV